LQLAGDEDDVQEIEESSVESDDDDFETDREIKVFYTKDFLVLHTRSEILWKYVDDLDKSSPFKSIPFD
jgi:hypothetical protein